MKFTEWSNSNNSLEGLLSPIFNKVKQRVLASMQTSDGMVRFSFPEEYLMPQSQPQMALAAGTITSGDRLEEGYLQQDPAGKIGLALKAAPGFAQSLSEPDQQQFLDLRGSIQTISRPLGLLFEIEVFFYLANQKSLQPKGKQTVEQLTIQWKDQYTIIEKRIGDYLANLIVGFTRHHAESLGESIYSRTISLLKDCQVDYVAFVGGEFFGSGDMSRKAADISLGCSAISDRSNIGYSIKFTSETTIPIAHVRPKHAFILLGGKKIVIFSKTLRDIPESKKVDFILDQFTDLAKDIGNHPVRLNQMINQLLFGTEELEDPREPIRLSDTLLAFRNYVKNRGNTSFTDALRQDFNVGYQPGNKLNVKPGAVVDVRRTKTYVLINIRGKDSRTGTNIKFEVTPESKKQFGNGQVVVKMNNLV